MCQHKDIGLTSILGRQYFARTEVNSNVEPVYVVAFLQHRGWVAKKGGEQILQDHCCCIGITGSTVYHVPGTGAYLVIMVQ